MFIDEGTFLAARASELEELAFRCTQRARELRSDQESALLDRVRALEERLLAAENGEHLTGFNVWTDWSQHVPEVARGWLRPHDGEPTGPYVWGFDEDWGDGGKATIQLFNNNPWGLFGAVYRVDGGKFQAFSKAYKPIGKPRSTIEQAALDLFHRAAGTILGFCKKGRNT